MNYIYNDKTAFNNKYITSPMIKIKELVETIL